MNERIVKWDLIPGLVMELVKLDKEGRREFFINLPIENVPLGALMDTFSIHVDEKGQVSFTLTPQEFHYNPLGTVHGGCLLYTSPSPRDKRQSRMPSSA